MSSVFFNIQFDQQGIIQLRNNNEQIIIVRSFAQDDEYVVACFVFFPFSTENIVQFNSLWQVYAAVLKIAPFATVAPAVLYPMVAGYKLQFTPIGLENPTIAYSPLVYGLENLNRAYPAIAGGLTQEISGGGITRNAIVNVSAIPFNQTTYYQPGNSIKVFVASGISNNVVLPASLLSAGGARQPGFDNITVGKYLEVDISSDAVISFDRINNVFVLR